MNYYYITGTSQGIGKAFAEYLLKDSSNKVIGLARKQSIKHSNYQHISIDLTHIDSIVDFKFENHSEAKKIYLINNAGALGEIKPVGNLTSFDIVKNYTLNLIAPSVLSNSFIKFYNDINAEKIIVNMSSGAAKSPIDGWSMYCSSKAGLDMFTRVVDAEQKIKSKHQKENNNTGFRIFSIAPGVVDTDMQNEIRRSSKDNFSRLEDFIGYKENKQLAQPEAISQKYFKLLSDLSVLKDVSFSIKDYE